MEPAEIRLIGGGSKSPAWRRHLCECLRMPVVTVSNPEGAAFGAAIQALSITRPEKSMEEWSDSLAETSERTEPSGKPPISTEGSSSGKPPWRPFPRLPAFARFLTRSGQGFLVGFCHRLGGCRVL